MKKRKKKVEVLTLSVRAPSGLSSQTNLYSGDALSVTDKKGENWLRVDFEDGHAVITLLAIPLAITPEALRSWAQFLEAESMVADPPALEVTP